ncbi:MAG TPA: amidase [Nocardioidaceae bacterium]|nr:amidase [Nocardioidaceae bacterium]
MTVPSPDAWELAAAIRAGETTAEETVADCLRKISEHDPAVNAFTVVLGEEALEAARAADLRREEAVRAGELATLPPLHGVPVSVKDHIWLAGAPATNGSVALAGFVPDVDAVPVARLKQAGAIVVGKTNNPEFCYRGFTDNDLWGLTRNPWSLEHTPGGSSGGAGASVAYGATPIALGTDGGGSIRIPAAFCGVVGHAPTFGLVPKLPGFRGWPSLSVDGPLARSVRDAALALAVVAGPAPEDPLSLPGPVGDLRAAVSRPVDWSRLRVAVSDDLGWAEVEPSVVDAFRAAVDTLADAGARVEEGAPRTTYPVKLWREIAWPEGLASEGPLLAEWGDRFTRGTRKIIESGRVSARAYLEAQARRDELSATWARFFESYDLLLAPSLPIPAFRTDAREPDGFHALAVPANLAGLPCCAVPTGLDPAGLPVGMQVLGPRWSDATVLAAAATWQSLAPSMDLRVPPARAE